MNPSYAYGCWWIAFNDEPTELDPEDVASYTTTLLLADLFKRDEAKVGADIVSIRLGKPKGQLARALKARGLRV